MPAEGPVSAEAVAELCRVTGLKIRQVRNLIAAFKRERTAEAISPSRRGMQPGTLRCSEHMQGAIKAAAKEIYLKRVPPDASEAAREIRSMLQEPARARSWQVEGENPPSVRTIERVLDRIPPPVLAKHTMGTSTRTAHEPHPGEYRSEHLLDLVQMDHTRGNVYLVDHETREPIGRPWVTFVIEVFTRAILGYYISMGAPSIYRCGRAIANAILPKNDLLKRVGLDGVVQLPMHGIFRRFHHDGAPAHKATNVLRACRYAGIGDPDARDPGPAHHGGHIERLIGTMLGKFKMLPGATGDDVGERDDFNPAEDSALSLKELERWLVQQIGIYHEQPHAGLDGRPPFLAWRKAAANGFPTFEGDRDRLFRMFLPLVDRGTRMIRATGVSFATLRYTDGPVAERSIFDHLGRVFPAHYDPYDLGDLFVDVDGRFHDLLCVNQRMRGVSFFEHQARRGSWAEENRAYLATEGEPRAQALRVAARTEVEAARKRTATARRAAMTRGAEGAAAGDAIISALVDQGADAAPRPKLALPADIAVRWTPVRRASDA